MKLKGKVALITGGGKGMGRAIGLAFATEGADIVVNDLDYSNAEKVADEIQSLGRQALANGADVSDSQAVDSMIKQAVIRAALETGAIITAEEHTIIGGLGGAVAEVLADAGIGVSFKRIGFPDVYSDIGPPRELLSRYGLDTDGIIGGVREVLQKKASRGSRLA